MKKACLILCVFLLMISFAYAQTPRNTVSSDGKSSFGNIAVTGLDVTGVPGYIEMTTSAGLVFYLYMDDDNKLRVVSDVGVGGNQNASPRTTDWVNTGQVVGDQAE